eukprot:TRINITY_DN23977_c0_g1_i1.p1 TRINITY_DN23977_c0_g1~~TRINITY_DN23977_c0_g1_i1.p1  ORF type:complete len:106 (+),score=26.59 TRINITY_DN23977_c0_g1_i1:53-370(+)
MVYTAHKVLRLPNYMARYWTTMKITPWPIFFATMTCQVLWLAKYTTLSTEQVKETYTSGYPVESDPLAAVDQKYYTMLFKQQGIDITSPLFTGMDRATLQKQIDA